MEVKSQEEIQQIGPGRSELMEVTSRLAFWTFWFRWGTPGARHNNASNLYPLPYPHFLSLRTHSVSDSSARHHTRLCRVIKAGTHTLSMMHRSTPSRGESGLRSLSYTSYASSSSGPMDDDSEKAPFIPLSNPSSSVSSRLSDAGSWLYTVPRRRRNLFALAFVALTGLFLYFHSQTPGPKLVCLDSSQLEELENIALPPALPVHVTKTSTSTVTVTAPAVTETVTVQKSSRTLEPVVFSLIMFSESSAIEGALLIKVYFSLYPYSPLFANISQSAIMYTTRPLEFHIICDEAAQSYLERKISVLQTPAHNILMRFYRVPHQSMVDRIRREGGIWSDHAAGVRACSSYLHVCSPDSHITELLRSRPSFSRAHEAFYSRNPARFSSQSHLRRHGCFLHQYGPFITCLLCCVTKTKTLLHQLTRHSSGKPSTTCAPPLPSPCPPTSTKTARNGTKPPKSAPASCSSTFRNCAPFVSWTLPSIEPTKPRGTLRRFLPLSSVPCSVLRARKTTTKV